MKKLLLITALSCVHFLNAQTLSVQGFTKLDVNQLATPAQGTVVPASDGGYFFARGLKVTKYQSDNTEAWSTSLTGTSRIGYTHAITGICDDGQGGAIITGKVCGTLGAGNDSITPFYTATGNGLYTADAFIARVNATGKVWWHRLGEYDQTSPGEDKGIQVAVNGGKVYWLAHATGRNLRFGSTNYAMNQYGNNVAILAQFMLDGTPDWIKLTKGGGAVPMFMTAHNENVCFSGYSLGSSTAIDFGNNIKLNYNQASFFAVKFTKSGAADWAVTYDDDNLLKNCYGFTSDDDGNLYACGIGSNFSNSYGIKKGQGYLVKMNGNTGAHEWTRTLSKVAGASNLLHGPLLGVQFANGKVYTCGNTNGNLYLQSTATDSVEMKLSSNLLAAEHFVAQYDKTGTLTASLKANGGAAGGTMEYLAQTNNTLIGIGVFSNNIAFGSHTMPATGGNVGAYFIGFYSLTSGGSSGLFNPTAPSPLTVYPNPTTGTLYIGETFNTQTEALVYSMDGKLVYRQVMQPLVSQSLDLNHLVDGIYYLQINNGHQTFNHKISKQSF